MTRRLLALALVALLPLAAACTSSNKVTSGRPSTAKVSASLVANAGFTKPQADCVAKALSGLSASTLRAIVNNDKVGTVSKAEQAKSTAAIQQALTTCAIPTTTTTIVPTSN